MLKILKKLLLYLLFLIPCLSFAFCPTFKHLPIFINIYEEPKMCQPPC